MSFQSLSLPDFYQIVNARLWRSSHKPCLVTIHVRKGCVELLEDQGEIQKKIRNDSDALYDAQGHVFLPAGVDLQVHLRVPGQAEKESPETGLRSAVKGGVGALLTMPNTKPVLDTPESLDLAREELREAQNQYGVQVWFSVAITKGQQGLELVDGQALRDAGALAFTDDGVGVMNDALMEAAFAMAAKVDLPLLQHAEISGHGAALAPGPLQAQLGLQPYPPEAEWKMVERDLRLLRKHPKARYHILHISSRKTLELLEQAKHEGLRVTGEATPHHLWLNSTQIREGVTAYKMNPPLRDEADREALVAALRSGLVNFMSTDHAPHEASKKGPDFRAAAFGSTGLESSLRVLLNLYHQGQLDSQRLVQVWATEASNFIGKANDFGDIREGSPLRAVWVDVNAKARIFEKDELESQSKNNCFLGHELSGRIIGVFNEDRMFRF